jgi:hypothetical protein
MTLDIANANNMIIYCSGPNSCTDHGCDKGTLAQGWGSGTADFPYLIDVSFSIKILSILA